MPSFRFHHLQDLFLFILSECVVFIFLALVLFPCDIIFTELLNNEYLLSFPAEDLLLLLLEHPLEFIIGLSFGAFSLFLSRMLLPFLLSHPFRSYFLNLILDSSRGTLTILRVSSILCLYFRSSRR